MCKGCFGRVERYERRAAAVFPKKLEGPLDANALTRLLNYGWTNTHKLPRIGRYLEGRIARSIHKRRFYSALQAALVLNELQKRCHTDVNLLYPHIERSMKAMIRSPDTSCRLGAVEMFITFSSVVEAGSPIQWDQDGLVHHFVDMANAGAKDFIDGTTPLSEIERQNQRMGGLRGLRAYFNLMRESPASLVEWSKILPTIFANMRYSAGPTSVVPNMLRDDDDEDGAIEEAAGAGAGGYGDDEMESPTSWTVVGLGRAALRDVASIVPTADVKSFVGHTLKILDKEKAWAQEGSDSSSSSFAVDVMRTVVVRGKSQDNQAAVERVLQHVDKQKDLIVKRRITIALIAILKDVPALLTVHGLIRSLLRQLSKARSGEASEEKRQLRDALADCTAAAVCRAGPRQLLDALGQINAAMFEACTDLKKPEEVSAERELFLERCFVPLLISANVESLPRGREAVAGAALASFVEAARDPKPEVRVYAMQCLSSMIGMLDRLPSSSALVGTPRSPGLDGAFDDVRLRADSSTRHRNSRGPDLTDHLWFRFDLPVKRAVLVEITGADTPVANYAAALNVLHASLSKFGAHDLITLIPMLFAAQDSAPALRASEVHVFVGAALQLVSRWVEDSKVTECINDVVQRRVAAGEGSSVLITKTDPSVGIALEAAPVGHATAAPSKKKGKRSKKAAAAAASEGGVQPVTILFKREGIVEALCAAELSMNTGAESSEGGTQGGASTRASGDDSDSGASGAGDRLRSALMLPFTQTAAEESPSKEIPVLKKKGSLAPGKGLRPRGSSGPGGVARKAGGGDTSDAGIMDDEDDEETMSMSWEEYSPRQPVDKVKRVGDSLRYVVGAGRKGSARTHSKKLPSFAEASDGGHHASRVLRRRSSRMRSAATHDSFASLSSMAERRAEREQAHLKAVISALQVVANGATLEATLESLAEHGATIDDFEQGRTAGKLPRLQEEYASCDLLSRTLIRPTPA